MTQSVISKRWALFGASRGLGRATYCQLIQKNSIDSYLLFARKKNRLDELTALCKKASYCTIDFTQSIEDKNLIDKINSFAPTHLIYFAAGGPFGAYETKQWKDHLWAYRLNFLFPAWLLYELLKNNTSCQQITFIGSSVCETNPDPNASSYASGKAALMKLITSIQIERIQNQQPLPDIRLLSPGYLDTELLPKNAWPRKTPELISNPDFIAKKLISWLSDEEQVLTHLTLK